MNKINLKAPTLDQLLGSRGIGFNSILDMVNDFSNAGVGTYPPYNLIEVDDNSYLVEIAIAGFTIDDLNITQEQHKLTIIGSISVVETDEADKHPTYLHKGISSKAFTREFALADHVIVEAANMTNGILTIELKRNIPDEMKPRTIDIK